MKSLTRFSSSSFLKRMVSSRGTPMTYTLRVFSSNVQPEPSEKIRHLSDEILNLDMLEINQLMQGLAVSLFKLIVIELLLIIHCTNLVPLENCKSFFPSAGPHGVWKRFHVKPCPRVYWRSWLT